MFTLFKTTFSELIVFFIVMAVGYFLGKRNVLPKGSDKTLSKLLSGAVMPALCFRTFSNSFTVENIKKNATLLGVSVIILIAAAILAVLLAKLFSKDKYIQNIYSYSFTIANLGYMGYPLCTAVFGQETFGFMMVFCIPFNIYIYSIGAAILNPNNPKVTLKSLVNPLFGGMVLGAIFGLLKIPVPVFVGKSVSLFADSMAFIAMLIMGFTISSFKLKEVIVNPPVYLAAVIRLVITPAVCLVILRTLGLSLTIQRVALCTLAMPLGLNTVVFPAAYGADTKLGASMSLISTALGLITIPLMFAVFGG